MSNIDSLNSSLEDIAEKVVLSHRAFGSRDRQKDFYNNKLREELSPYVNEDLLQRMAPSQEDLADEDFYDDSDLRLLDEIMPPDYWTTSEVLSTSVLVDRKSIDENCVYVLIEAIIEHDDSSKQSFQLQETYNLYFEKEGLHEKSRVWIT